MKMQSLPNQYGEEIFNLRSKIDFLESLICAAEKASDSDAESRQTDYARIFVTGQDLRDMADEFTSTLESKLSEVIFEQRADA